MNDQIKLPEIELTDRSILEAYGGLNLLAEYCGLSKPIYQFKYKTHWVHGWGSDYHRFHPIALVPEIVSHGNNNKENLYLVHKKEDEIYLKENGYLNSKAIGCQTIYVPEKKTNRIENSLLVMPVHSLDYTSHNHWKFKEYVEDIKQIKNQFSRVLVCLHPLCIQNKYWVNEFKEADFEIVVGAYGPDKNALKRLQILMSTFEFVTTNGHGSHIAYASFFGAKVSIYGSFAQFKPEDYIGTWFYENYYDLILKSCSLTEKKFMENVYPWLFCQPKEATQHIEWGKYELGYDNKLSKEEILELFGWKNFYWTPRGWKYWLSENTPEFIKSKIRIILNLFKIN